MFTVVECVVYQHNNAVVGIAASILIAGMLAFFHLLVRARESTESRKRYWFAIAALSAGLSIWATHFVAMLAYEGVVPIGFDPTFTALSALVAVVGIWVALFFFRTGSAQSVVPALLIAATTATMHFLGMVGMRVSAQIVYQAMPIIVGTITSLLFFFAGLHAFQRLQGKTKILFPALASIIAVCVLHFTAMSSTILLPDPSLPGPEQSGHGRIWLTMSVSGVTALVLGVTVVGAIIDRLLVDLKGFSNASLDGLAIIRDNKIVEVNTRFVELVGREEVELIGGEIDDYLSAKDELGAGIPRPFPVEAAPRLLNNANVYELAVNTVEYRGRPSQVVAIRDLTERITAQRKVEYLARHDTLTGLANRAMFQERLSEQVDARDKSFAVIALDLDRFKAVNDLFGHAEGDRVLKDVAGILNATVSQQDTVARLGGDEFMIITAPGAGAEHAHDLACRVLGAFRGKMDPSADPAAVGVSIGIAMFPGDGEDNATLIYAADLALYRAKTNGRGGFAFYDLAMDQETRKRRQLEADLRQATTRGELYILYQPIQSVDEGIVGYEALLRWRHPVHGDIPPDRFIPIAEESGTIFSIGEWVLREACRTATSWDPHLKVAVNVSPVQFRAGNLAFSVFDVLRDAGLQPSRLELEITETTLLQDRESVLETLRQLKALGVSIVMDDFGTGYSSLSNLQSFRFDKLKIDRSFIATMNTDNDALTIVKAIVGLGRSLNLPVTAEGIETLEQYEIVVAEGCAQAQGYLFGKPGAAPVKTSLSRYPQSSG